tara:strand:- start:65 stop:436 length:372 start_codon:yes stop_codon:yes gene_type:complete
MELKNAEIIKIGKVQTFANDFKKLEFIVKDDSSMYPQEIQFNILKDKIDDFIKFNKVGQRVDVSFNLNGRSWLKEGAEEIDRRWFNSLDAWKVFKAEATTDDVEAFKEVDAGDLKQVADDLPF